MYFFGLPQHVRSAMFSESEIRSATRAWNFQPTAESDAYRANGPLRSSTGTAPDALHMATFSRTAVVIASHWARRVRPRPRRLAGNSAKGVRYKGNPMR